MNALSKMTAFLITIIMLFLLPLLHHYERQEDLVRLNTHNAVTKFVDAVRNKGYLTPAMYNEFTEELALSRYEFEIELIHEQKTYVPVYTDPADSSTFQNQYMVTYENFYTPQIKKILFPDNSLPLDSEDRRYQLMTGDYFKVAVKNSNRSPATVIWDFLTFGDSTGPEISIPYGGMVHNEDY